MRAELVEVMQRSLESNKAFNYWVQAEKVLDAALTWLEANADEPVESMANMPLEDLDFDELLAVLREEES